MHTNLICGVDEAGRGPLAGPVYAAAVILGPDFDTEGLRDSKKISDNHMTEDTSIKITDFLIKSFTNLN